MATTVQSRFWLVTIGVVSACAVAACSKPPVICGGEVSPKNATDAELQLVDIARDRSTDLCNQPGSACDFNVYKTKAGRTVKATRSFAYDGRCITRIGDERFYSFDESGRLESVINGL